MCQFSSGVCYVENFKCVLLIKNNIAGDTFLQFNILKDYFGYDSVFKMKLQKRNGFIYSWTSYLLFSVICKIAPACSEGKTLGCAFSHTAPPEPSIYLVSEGFLCVLVSSPSLQHILDHAVTKAKLNTILSLLCHELGSLFAEILMDINTVNSNP